MKLLSQFFNKPGITIKDVPLTIYRGDKTPLFFTCQFRDGYWLAGYTDPTQEAFAWVARLTYSSKDLDEVNQVMQNIIKYSIDAPEAKYFRNCPDEPTDDTYDKSKVLS